MKNILSILVIATFSCQKEKAVTEIFPFQDSGNKRWIVYEGRVPVDEETYLHLEVSMLPSDVLGEGRYRLTESVQEEDRARQSSEMEGTYSTIYGDGPEELIVQFYNSARQEGIKRTYLSHSGRKTNSGDSGRKVLKEESFRHTDLILRSEGKNKLLVLDQSLEPITDGPEYNLIKRTSRLFTVEGYFRHNGDTADFLEINTQERWGVAKLGEYGQACNEYHKLVKEKFDVTYLKATAYTISNTDPHGADVDALVFKKILQMTSTPQLDSQ